MFAEAKDWHSMRRFRLRRLEKVNSEALLITTGQNVKGLAAFGGLGGMAQIAALRVPDELCSRPVLSHRTARRCVFQQLLAS